MFCKIAILLVDQPELFVITDIPFERAKRLLEVNGFLSYFDDDHIKSADWAKHGDRCKEYIMKELDIDFMFDDRLDYIIDGCKIGCLIVPRKESTYYHETWDNDGQYFT